MKAANRACMFACILSTLAGAGTAGAQTVSVAPIVRLTPTGVDRFPFPTPPQSATSVPIGTTFFIEIWATNVSAPLNGLECVYADLTYSKTSLVDSVPPAEDSGLFAIDDVGANFDDAAGTIDTVGGCQADPAIAALGVDEWVLVKRIEMSAVVIGGSQTVSLQDAGDASPGVLLLGEPTAEDPADIDFQSRDFIVRCTSVDDCDDENRCTNDFCLVGICSNNPIAGCCRDAADCHDNDECTDDICNLQATCENPFAADGTPCGDDTSSDCDAADTCDGDGFCQPNLAPSGDSCSDDGKECSSDVCDGVGGCTHPNLPDQTPCNSDGNECTGNVCSAGECEHPPLATGTACGDATASDCDNADSCDGNGACLANFEPDTTVCRDAANECDLAESCTGQSAACPVDEHVEDGTSCNSDGNDCTDNVCSEGACDHPPLATGTACGDATVSDCDNADSCDGIGACLANFEPDTTVCRDATNECDLAESCTGQSAACPADQHVGDGTPCNSDGNDCTDNVCSAGECEHPPLATGTACGDASVSDCDSADSCDGNGACLANFEPDTTACRDATNECDVAESCTGQSAHCPADEHLPNGLSCSNDLFCDGAETCQTGTCQTGSLPCVDQAHCDELGQSCLECVSNAECDDNDICTSDACSENICVHEPLSTCGPTARLDIRPGACPNQINTSANGVMPVAIVATSGFDIGLVDPASLALVRTDGIGGEVLPNRRNNGEVKVALEDVATPFSGETCECNKLDGDGLIDLFLKFSMTDIVEALALDEENDGTTVELALEGSLLDGTPFSATDCVRVRVTPRKSRRTR